MKKSRLIFILLLLGLCSICTAGWLFFLYSPTVKEPHGIVYYLKPGTAKSTLIADLSAQKIISSPSLFSLSLYSQVILSAGHGHLKTGEYLFPYGSTPASILKQVTSGTGYYYRSFTIVPGWTFAQLREELKKTDTLRHSIHSLTDQNIMERLGDATLPAEGEFFPETYLYTRGVADLVILKQAFNLMQQRLQTAWQTRVSQLPYLNPYQVLIAASLVEKEAYLKSEMPMIAGVLVNRLTKNMLLQFDPTTIVITIQDNFFLECN